MSMTVPASSPVVESAIAVTPAVLNSGQGIFSAQPGTSVDNIVWGTSSDDDGRRGDSPNAAIVIWQSSFEGGDGQAGTRLNPL
jgi:hypothetical protein